MKTSTKKVFAFSLMLIATVTLSAQMRWNPNDWKTVQSGATDAVDTDNKIFEVTPTLHNASDNTQARGDAELKVDVTLTDEEPYIAFMLTTENCRLNIPDWKLQFMLQRQKATTATDNGDGTWTYAWGASGEPAGDPEVLSFKDDKWRFDNQWNAERFELLGTDLSDGGVDIDDSRTDVWVVDMNKVREISTAAEDLFLSSGTLELKYHNPWALITENGEGAIQQRSWIALVLIGRNVADVSTARFKLHYAATVADPNDVLNLIEAYKDGDGGKEVRDDDDESSVKLVQSSNINIYKNDNKIIAPAAARLEVYNLGGACVASVNDNQVTLESGFYIVKAYNESGSKVVKVIVK